MKAIEDQTMEGTSSVTYRMFEAYREMVEFYQREFDKSPAEALEMVDNLNIDYLAQQRPEQVSWHDLGKLARINPDLARQRWAMVKATARRQFLSGERASEAVNSPREVAWEQAQFLAIRETMVEEWQPRGGIEYSLIDMMAQSFTLYMRWMQTLSVFQYSEMVHGDTCEKKCGHRPPPTPYRYDGMQQAVEMADRFNRIYLRSLRQLRDLRRYSVTINAEQVNIGQQQVNTTGDIPHPKKRKPLQEIENGA